MTQGEVLHQSGVFGKEFTVLFQDLKLCLFTHHPFPLLPEGCGLGFTACFQNCHVIVPAVLIQPYIGNLNIKEGYLQDFDLVGYIL